jgi:hypothetical protein
VRRRGTPAMTAEAETTPAAPEQELFCCALVKDTANELSDECKVELLHGKVELLHITAHHYWEQYQDALMRAEEIRQAGRSR